MTDKELEQKYNKDGWAKAVEMGKREIKKGSVRWILGNIKFSEEWQRKNGVKFHYVPNKNIRVRIAHLLWGSWKSIRRY